jgi:hypothetical protein
MCPFLKAQESIPQVIGTANYLWNQPHHFGASIYPYFFMTPTFSLTCRAQTVDRITGRFHGKVKALVRFVI